MSTILATQATDTNLVELAKALKKVGRPGSIAIFPCPYCRVKSTAVVNRMGNVEVSCPNGHIKFTEVG
jgi:hypothetical protein